MTDNKRELRLSQSKDWDVWLSFIRAKAVGHRIWDLIDPSKPSRPKELSEPQEPNRNTLTGNNEEKLPQYKMLMVEYKNKCRLYDKQQEAMGKIISLIYDTTSVTNLTYIQKVEVHPWDVLRALRQRLAPSDSARSFELEQEYTRLKKGPSGRHSSEAWIDEYLKIDCPQNGLKAPPIKYPNQTSQFDSIIDDFGGGRGNNQSEDCLTLNIWTKSPDSHKKKGVLIWIHGGRFTVGDTNTPFYRGQYLVDEQDIVFVSINYRINIFGFSGAPGEPANVGLLDQRKAIEWVRDNIAGFGGDPTRISIMGQSAGGSAVDYYSYTYKNNPIVAGLISHSGTALSFKPNTPDFSRNSFLSVALILGCYGPDVVPCMRNQSTSAILNASTKAKPLPSKALAQPVFHPAVDNITVFANYSALSAAGAFAKIPYLAGNTDKEDGFYRISAAGQNITLTEQQWLTYDLEGFTCATGDEIAARAKAGVPSWRFRYFGDWPNLRLYPGSGAYHGVDLHMIFGGIEDVVGKELPDSAEEILMTKYMMRAWATFVNDPTDGLSTKMRWPTYNPNGTTLVRLAYGQIPGASFVSPVLYDQACPSNGSVAEAQGAF